MPEVKEVKMRLRDVVNRYGSINKLREAPKVRAKLGFEIAKLAGALTTMVRGFEEARNSAAKKLSEKDKDGNPSIPPAKQAEFQEEMEELLDAEVIVKAEPVNLPANFEMDGMVAVLSDWSEFLTVDGKG
ncbi:MAG: hypothetical protein ABIL09_07965 [Gemmatimonadota bacterium]